jgi:hypothetical protein
MAVEKNITIDSTINAKNAKYQSKGVVYASNISTVNKRDEAGNVVYEEGGAIPLLVIEGIAENIINSSVLKVVDTQFNYYKFPARTNVIPTEQLNLGIDPEDFNPQITPEPLPTKYAPIANQNVAKGDGFSTLEFSKVLEGPPVQETPNSFTVTQEVLDRVNGSLKFSGLIRTYYNSNNNSRVQFTITEYDVNGFALPQEREGGFAIPVWYPTGTDDEGKVRQEKEYSTIINLNIAKSFLSLGHTYRIMGRTDESTDTRFHEVRADDTFIRITGV